MNYETHESHEKDSTQRRRGAELNPFRAVGHQSFVQAAAGPLILCQVENIGGILGADGQNRTLKIAQEPLSRRAEQHIPHVTTSVRTEHNQVGIGLLRKLRNAVRVVFRAGERRLPGIGANRAGELFAGIVAEVPFVDVLNTMLDDTLPLTPPEWPEWGNPIESEKDFRTILSYSPYDNVAARDYPAILAMGGLTDPRVTYWEPAKWIARLREKNTSGNMVLLQISRIAWVPIF